VVTARARRWLLVLWIPAAVAGGIVTIEILLQIRAAATEYLRAARPSAFRGEVHRLRDAYRPFTTQHLHPYYLFFFPLQAADRAAIANAVCSIDADGFREPGPAASHGRPLAVLLGGSTAFGDYASSNDATITSYLNRMQDRYYFINAGVPSWNSTQELVRMALQIAALKPALVVTLDGANDAALADAGSDEHPERRYPAATPENFGRLESIIEDAQHAWPRLTWRRVFPEIANRIDKYTSRDDVSPPMPPAVIAGAAQQYVENLTQIAALSHAAGARFISIFQPIAGLHHHVSPDAYDPRDFVDAAAFRDAALALPATFERRDFSSMFDELFASVPVLGDDLTAETIFVDEVHLSDRGNELMARRLEPLLAAAQ
jgi:lysophospholipase L1-like esterase